MAPTAGPNQDNDFPAEACPLYLPRQPHNNPLQTWAPPARVPATGQHQPEGHREDILQPIRPGVDGSGGIQDPHNIDVTYQGPAIDHRPPPRANPVCTFLDVEHAQVQPNALLNQIPQQQVPPYPPQAAFAHPFIHRIPPSNQRKDENLRRVAKGYMDHPKGRIRMVSTEESIGGGYKTVIIIETPDIP